MMSNSCLSSGTEIPLQEIRRSNSHPRQDVLDMAEITFLSTLLSANPEKNVFYPEGDLKHTVYRFPDFLAVQDHLLGGGFWGEVYSGAYYDPANLSLGGKKCVLKLPHQSSQYKSVLSSAMNLNHKMIREAELNKVLHHFGSSVTLTNEKKHEIVVIAMPFLGETSLDALLKNKEKFQKIDFISWVNLFVRLCSQLQKLHKHGYLHNDIKPVNIGIVLNDDKQTIKEANFFDLGNAQRMKEAGSFGDPGYQPVESVLVGFFVPAIKNSAIDIAALGYTLNPVINELLKNQAFSLSEKKIIAECGNLFSKMTSFAQGNRPSLESCLNVLDMCLAPLETEKLYEESRSYAAGGASKKGPR